MGDGDQDRRAAEEAAEHERRRRTQRQREEADPAEHDAASGPGYTARPSGEDADEEPPPRG